MQGGHQHMHAVPREVTPAIWRMVRSIAHNACMPQLRHENDVALCWLRRAQHFNVLSMLFVMTLQQAAGGHAARKMLLLLHAYCCWAYSPEAHCISSALLRACGFVVSTQCW